MAILSNADILDRAAYYEGRVLENYDAVTDTVFTQEATEIIPFGFTFVQGTAFNQRRLPVDEDSVFTGFAVAVGNFEKRIGQTVNGDNRLGYPSLAAELVYPMTEISLGRIAVPCSTAMARGAEVYFVYTADGAVAGERVGMVRNSDNTDRAKLIGNCRVIIPAIAAGIVVVELF